MTTETKTRFAPAKRATIESVNADHAYFADKELVERAIDSVPDVFLILNRQRQIVYANRAFPELLGLDSRDAIRGARPGEALGCSHAARMPGGCGTSEFCRHCGVVNAILLSQKGERSTRECRITRAETGEALDFSVLAVPLIERGEVYTVLALKDISHEKRRRVLERVFFHDILNSLGGLFGLSERLERDDSPEVRKLFSSVRDTARLLLDEINAQKELVEAENGTLKVKSEEIDADDLLHSLIANYQNHVACRGRRLRQDPQSDAFNFHSDPALLGRVIGNMIKNALEAVETGETVTIAARKLNRNQVEFSVRNPGVMPRPVQLQIFQRSFSTKGDGRGLGTYSVKLLGEKYLKGEVAFETAAVRGTVFQIRLPLKATKKKKGTGEEETKSVGRKSASPVDASEAGRADWAIVDDVRVSADDVREPKRLLVTLEKLMVENYAGSREHLMMLEIEAFADKLREAGERHGVAPLRELADKLKAQVDDFDVETLPATLELFPGLLKKLRKILSG